MASVSIHPPKTPVTAGSMGIAQNTVPNVCKMPGPPAPFVPTPLPNIGRSAMSPRAYSTTVKIEGNAVAIMGASFGSMGDIASKGTGGGVVSNNCEGPTKFIAPGSLTVNIEGKNVHLLSDIMSNNNGPSGSPPNAATMMGLSQADAQAIATAFKALCKEFCKEVKKWKSSKQLEDRLKKNSALAKMGVAITPKITHVLGGVVYLTIPDAMQTMASGNKQCFDFKGPRDRWRNNQRARQTRLAKRVPKEVSRKTCGC